MLEKSFNLSTDARQEKWQRNFNDDWQLNMNMNLTFARVDNFEWFFIIQFSNRFPLFGVGDFSTSRHRVICTTSSVADADGFTHNHRESTLATWFEDIKKHLCGGMLKCYMIFKISMTLSNSIQLFCYSWPWMECFLLLTWHQIWCYGLSDNLSMEHIWLVVWLIAETLSPNVRIGCENLGLERN